MADDELTVYERAVRWCARHWDTILEIIICLVLLAVGVIVGGIIVMARIAGFIGSGGNPF